MIRGLETYANEVRDGADALLSTLVAVGDLLADNASADSQEEWEEHKDALRQRGRL